NIYISDFYRQTLSYSYGTAEYVEIVISQYCKALNKGRGEGFLIHRKRPKAASPPLV
ncbi:Hypothetical predicted protein, partial [Pelobates cultripes]